MSLLPPAQPRQTDDPSARVVLCENPACAKPVSVGDSHSFVITYATTGADHLPAFGCDAEQHFCCSQECARLCAHACIDEHLAPGHAARVAAAAS